MKKGRGKIVALIIFICVAFVSGVLLYKSYLNTGIVQEEEKPEIVEEVAPSKKDNDKKNPKEPEPPLVVEEIEIEEPEEEILLEEEIQEEKVSEIELPKEVEEQRELLPIHIPHVKSLFNSSDLSIQNLPDKKQYYNGNNGTIESIIERKGDLFYEYLISYDYKGNKVDRLEIGIIDENAQKKKHAVLFQNNISTFETSSDSKGKAEEVVTTYQITPDLRFIKGKTYKKIL